MRIVAGDFKGRIICAPEGTDTRPTTDRVREALFSSLFSMRGSLEGAVVLDAFAGTGALGLEALSRGAARAVFCECNAKAARILKENVAVCGLDVRRAHVMVCDVMKACPGLASFTFDLLFFDPPYRFAAAEVLDLLGKLEQQGALAQDAIIVYEHALSDKGSVEDAVQSAGFCMRGAKNYGKTAVSVLGIG